MIYYGRFIASPIGRYFGIRETLPKKAERIPELEAGYKKYGKAASGETLMVSYKLKKFKLLSKNLYILEPANPKQTRYILSDISELHLAPYVFIMNIS